MRKDIRIIFDHTSERVYAGKSDNDNDRSMGDLVDVTEDFYNVLFAFLPPGSIRAFGNGNPASEDYDEDLLICARNDPKSLLRAIGAIKVHMEENFSKREIDAAKKDVEDKNVLSDG